MTGLLIIGGTGPTADTLAAHAIGWDRVVAADSGYDLAQRLGLSPELVVGDMDSISPESLRRISPTILRRYPAEKDETDTEIGLRVLAELGCDATMVVGGGGGRMDHFLGIFELFAREDAPSLWITGDTVFVLIADRIEVGCRLNEVVSFLSVGGEAVVLGSRGLKWPLTGLTIGRGRASLSNVAVSETISVRVESGRVVMVRSTAE